MNYGFIRVAAAIPDIKVADCSYNISQIIDIAQKGLCKIIITGNRDLTSLTKDQSRLANKLIGALIVEMKSMDRELVQNYITIKAAQLDFELTDEQRKVIINRSMQNGHAINGTIVKFKNLKELQLENICKLNDDNQTSLLDYENEVIEKLIDDVAKEFNISKKVSFCEIFPSPLIILQLQTVKT
jgi:chromosomal replication initiation ATPase DnaA